ncbi:hypothetical protein BX070DRAFT_235714 [Coemansia spiralis]|nr:hypothetical protein BX070DRAFT_235714 [Coemansia spiralis]
MKEFSVLLALTAGLSAIVSASSIIKPRLVGSGQMDFGVHGSNNIKSPLSVRQTVTSGGIGTLDDPITEITNASTGILYKNDGQTYCEVAITSQNFGIAAASCFDYAGGNVDLSVKYFVMMSSNTQIAAFGTYAVQVVTPHPNYNPTTYANNIAVLKLTTLTNVMPYHFNAPIVATTNATSDTTACSAASAVYAKNPDGFVCSTLTVTSYLNTACVAPYGSVYGVNSPNSAKLGALFSHSAIYGSGGYCGKGPFYNYYTILRNYIPWISQQYGGQINTYHTTGATSYVAASNANYQMNNPTAPAADNVAIIGNYTESPVTVERQAVLEVPAIPAVSLVDAVDSTDIITQTSTEIASSVQTVTTTTTSPTTATTETTLTVSTTTTLTDTSTSVLTLTSIEVSVMTVTATNVVPTVIGATNIGNGQVETVTVTVSSNLANPGQTIIQSMPGSTVTITETATTTEAAQSVTVTTTATLTPLVVSSVSTLTFTDIDFYTLVSTTTSLSTTTVTSGAFLSAVLPNTGISSASSELPTESSSESNLASSEPKSKDKMSVGLISAIVVILLLLLGAIIGFCIYRKRKNRSLERQEVLAYNADMCLASKGRVNNWYLGKFWDRLVGSKEAPPDYMSSAN